MSGLPIMSVSSAPPTPAREGAPTPLPAAFQSVTSAVKTMTPTAVQQLQSAGKGEQVAHKLPSGVHDRRARLIGPPPAFEVNLLRHMQETRMDPPDPAHPEPDLRAPRAPEGGHQPTGAQHGQSGYDALPGYADEQTESTANTMDLSV